MPKIKIGKNKSNVSEILERKFIFLVAIRMMRTGQKNTAVNFWTTANPNKNTDKLKLFLCHKRRADKIISKKIRSIFRSLESWNWTAGRRRKTRAKRVDLNCEAPIFLDRKIINTGKKLPKKIKRNEAKESPRNTLPLANTVSVAAGRISLGRTPVATKFLIVKKYSVAVSHPSVKGKKWCKKLNDVTTKKMEIKPVSSFVISIFLVMKVRATEMKFRKNAPQKTRKTSVKIPISKNPNRAIGHKAQEKTANPKANFSRIEIFVLENDDDIPSPIPVRKIVKIVAEKKKTKSVPKILKMVSSTETSVNKF